MSKPGTIGGIRGVDQYVWVDANGTLLAHDAKKPKQLAQMAVSCASPLSAMGKNNFIYLSFLRGNQANIYIFPVGNGYLGVVKQEGVEDGDLVKAVTEFLNAHGSQGSK